MTKRHSSGRRRSHFGPAIALCLGCVLAITLLCQTAAAQYHQRDRFGIRGGIWPQKEVRGSFGVTRISPDDTTHYATRITEDQTIAPYVEVFGLFHLRNNWWVEASVGWGARYDVQVRGVSTMDSVLLGRGRIDFFPMFGGVRFSRSRQNVDHPHTVFLRAGPTLVFANESPDLVKQELFDNGLYSTGTKGAFGFLIGGGGELYVSRRVGFLLDASFRYTNFKYARDAEFDLSNVWLGAGLIFRSR